MSKFRVDSPANTPLDPFAFEKQFAKPDTTNNFNGVADQLEFVTPIKIDEGYGTMGNSGYAQQVINEAKAANQSSLELTGKGLVNVAKTIGIEVGKIPGYAGGLTAAGANEIFGDGKNSMSLIVDNAWVNAFEKMDKDAQAAMPIYISQQVQEGNLLDKMGSGAWWATTGANGLGFMLSMFLPGAALKALKIGELIAAGGEGLANLSPTLGRLGTGAGLLESAGAEAFAYTKAFAQNANGFASAAVNTAIEASAEAANTFENVKSKYLSQGLSEEEANNKAGESASAVFKGNLALLAVSNILDEMWIWKTIGSAGEKEAAQSILSKVFKDGEIDMTALKNIPKEFTRANVLKKVAANFGKGVTKEGFFEEGTQTLLQQNIEGGKNKHSVIGNLSDVVSSYFKDFADNDELHESIFLGGLLGGGASIIATVQENNALRAALTGGSERTRDNSFWAKYGILPEKKAQKGLLNIIKENHIQQFRSYKDFLEDDGSGIPQLNEQKLMDAHLEQSDNLRANILYDISAAQGNKLGQEIFGQFLAANYVQGFLGQEGSKELFKDHVEKQVLPAWQKRFTETFGREATPQESQNYLNNFKKSGERVIDAYKSAENTNYPERYYSEPTKEYQDFKHQYLHNKFQTLVTLDSVKERKNSILSEMTEVGVFDTDLEEINKIQDPIKKLKAKEIKDDLDELKEVEDNLSEEYTKFFTKKGVEEMFNAFKERRVRFQEIKKEVEEENQKLKQQVETLPSRNETELARLQAISDEKGGDMFKGVDGNKYSLPDLKNYTGDIVNLGLQYDDLSKEEYDSFKDTGVASPATLRRIAQKMVNKEPLSNREQDVALSSLDTLNAIFDEEVAKVKETITNQTPQSKSDESVDAEEVAKTIDDHYKRKSVNLYPSTGRNLENEFVEIDGKLVEKLTTKPSQKLWFEVLDSEVKNNPTAYTVQVIRLDDKSNVELHNQIMRDASPDPSKRNDGDLYTVLHKDDKPVLKDGNYVFTGLWRPSTLYPTSNGKPSKFVLAEKSILNNFLLHIKLPDLDISNLSNTQKDYLKTFGITNFTEEGIMTAAFFHAKDEYTKWYQNLQDNPAQLQVAGITNGHTVKVLNQDKTTSWNGPLGNIPGLKIVKNKLVGGKFEMSVTGTIKVNNEEISIPVGDTVIVDSDNNIHPLRARNLNEDEIKTVLYLLSLRTQKGPTESIKVKPVNPAIYGNTKLKEIPVFYNEKNPRANLIESLISFGSKNGGKGEIYFNKDTVNTNPLLVWTDFAGNTHNIEVSKIKQAVDSNDFTLVKPLMDFLSQKRVNVNEQLLGSKKETNTFSKPTTLYKRDTEGVMSIDLTFGVSDTYFDFLLGDVLTTTTKQIEGYPQRVQRNLWFNKQPIQPAEDLSQFVNVFEITDEGKAVPIPEAKPSRRRAIKSLDEFKEDADKILTTTDLLKSKIQSGEIIQNCK